MAKNHATARCLAALVAATAAKVPKEQGSNVRSGGAVSHIPWYATVLRHIDAQEHSGNCNKLDKVELNLCLLVCCKSRL